MSRYEKESTMRTDQELHAEEMPMVTSQAHKLQGEAKLMATTAGGLQSTSWIL
jgi:hypothetical protein